MIINKKNFDNYNYKWAIWICVLFVFEFFLFKRYVSIKVENFYPAQFDQAAYLPLFYRTYEAIQKQGFISGLVNSPTLANAILFPIQASISFLIFGASRFNALLINFVYLIALQLYCILTVKAVFKKSYLAILFLGMFLCINAPFSRESGGLFDVRTDLIAFCAYGIFVCSVIRSQFFLDRKWSVLSALMACLTILLRTITLVYFSGIIACLLVYLLFKQIKGFHAQTVIHKENKTRLVNLILFCVSIAIIAVPWVWMNKEALYNYYVVGHILNGEKYIRALEAGITNTWQSIFYYSHSLLFIHIGNLALTFFISLFLLYSLLHIIYKKYNPSFFSSQKSRSTITMNTETWRMGTIFLLASIFVPMIILTLDVSKSPIVANIMVTPTIWLFFWYYAYIDSRIGPKERRDSLFKKLAIILLLIGLVNMTHELLVRHSKRQLKDLPVITKMYLDIGNYITMKKWQTPNIGFDQVCDYLTSGGIETLYYESRGKLLNLGVNARLGGSIFAITEKDALAGLQSVNVLIINLNNNYPKSFYPYNQTILPLRSVIINYAENHFKILGDYQFKNAIYRVYVAN